MRAALLALALLAPAASASEPMEILLDWFDGEFAAGAPRAVAGVNAVERAVVVGACHRDLRADVLYDPDEAVAALSGVGEVALAYEMRVEVLSGASIVAKTTAQESRHDHRLGVAPAGSHTLRLSLETGADVSWSFRLRGWMVPEDPACGAILATDPKG